MLRPETEDEVAEAVRGAAGPLRIRGGGTRGVTGAGVVLDISGLSGITLYEPGALTLVVRAGTPLAEVEAVLAAEGQRLAFEPGNWRGLMGTDGVPTVGGVAAANVAGPRRVQAGAARDALLGLRFVDGTGMVVKSGGRVMKNVTGYDLVKLLAGSWGTLGVLTEISLKVLPAAGAIATLIVPVGSVDAAVGAMAAALTSPFDVTGAAMLPGTGVMIRIEGFEGSVAYRAAALAQRLQAHGPVTVERDPQAAAVLWQQARDVAPFHGVPGDVWRFSVKPGDAPAICARLGGPVMLDWGGGLIWALLPEGTDARAVAMPYAGHATLIRASAATRARVARFEPEGQEVAALTAGLRAKFDPKGILNPGLMEGASGAARAAQAVGV